MSNHTPEPLQIVDSLIYRLTDNDGVNTDEINVTMWNGSRDADKRTEGARRVFACMNACAGWPTLFLESVIISGRTLQGISDETVLALHKAEQQRDELLAALKTIHDLLPKIREVDVLALTVDDIAKIAIAKIASDAITKAEASHD